MLTNPTATPAPRDLVTVRNDLCRRIREAQTHAELDAIEAEFAADRSLPKLPADHWVREPYEAAIQARRAYVGSPRQRLDQTFRDADAIALAREVPELRAAVVERFVRARRAQHYDAQARSCSAVPREPDAGLVAEWTRAAEARIAEAA